MGALRRSLINLLLRNVTKRRLSSCRTPLDVRSASYPTGLATPTGVRFVEDSVGGVPGEWAEAKKRAADGTLLYLHGGGYVGMSARTHRMITGAFALRGFRVFAADYRLAPEHKFPAALNDAMAAWRALRAQIEGPICVAGDSAGGGLALALLLALRDHREQGPVSACLFSPWTDLAATGVSATTNRFRDPVLDFDVAEMLARAYAGEADLRNPLVSPLYGDMTGLPPMALFVGDTEMLLDDSTRVAERARSVGVTVDLRVYRAMPHVWPALHMLLPEARQALDEAGVFLRAAHGSAASDFAAGPCSRRLDSPAA
jgi:monoterpene epsilon-lactone hydrolase